MVIGMATCKDCLHIEVCAYCVNDLPICDSFKGRTKYVEVVHGKWILVDTEKGMQILRRTDGFEGMTDG